MNKYFPASLNVKGRRCLVIGSDREADEKSRRLRDAGAKLRVISESAFSLRDIKDQFFVVFCPRNNPDLTKKVAAVCRKRRILLCAIDQPEYCDVVNVSTFDKGLLRIMAATHGAAPSISRKIREGLEESMKGVPVDAFLDHLANLRVQLKKSVPDTAERIRQLIAATDGFEFKASVKLPKKWRKK
jgi:siroheme synthase (precorrin-2 oxidase/ferrochelatase)